MTDQFYLELPGGEVVGERNPDGTAVLFYSGRGGFRLDVDQVAQLHDWTAAIAAAPAAPAPTAPSDAPPAPAAPVVPQGGAGEPATEPSAAPAAPGGDEQLVTVQLTQADVVRLRALLSPVAEIKPEA